MNSEVKVDDKIKNLWNRNKLLFALLIPFILLIVFKDLIFAILSGSVKREIKNAIREDDLAAKKQQGVINEAERHEAKASAKEEAIEDRDTNAISEDWHLKRRN